MEGSRGRRKIQSKLYRWLSGGVRVFFFINPSNHMKAL